MKCPFCDNDLEEDDSRFLICREHEDILVTAQLDIDDNIEEIYIAKKGYEFNLLLDEKETVIYKYKDFGKHYDPFFSLNNYCYLLANVQYKLMHLEYLVDVTPETFDEVLERMKALAIFS